MTTDFDPTVQTWHSKVDLPTPNPHMLYCIRKIVNYPELGYCYLTVHVDRAGAPYETILFYTYAPVNGEYTYSKFIEDIKELAPLHCTRIKDYLLTFEKDKECPCGWVNKEEVAR
jgi:hypothetical protein